MNDLPFLLDMDFLLYEVSGSVQRAQRGDAHSDNSQFTTTPSGAFTDFAIALPGNTTFILSSTGYGYSHANLHGDTIAITDLNGTRIWQGHNGPYGEPASGATPTNTNVPGTAWGWHGQQQRLTDRTLIHLGARPYHPTHGRFLQIDPIEGGCANEYTYVHGDPVNQSDISGLGFCGLPP